MFPNPETASFVYRNLLNGCTFQQVGSAFNLSEKEILEAFSFVTQKIKSYALARGYPYVPCETLDMAKAQRRLCLAFLDKLNLEKPPLYAKITEHTVRNGDEIEAMQFLGGIS